jgi:DNA-binding MarR family transcriptional regulator
MKGRKKTLHRPRRISAPGGSADRRMRIGRPMNSDESSPAHSGSLDGSLGYAIRRAQIHAYQKFADFMREFNIRPAQYALLVFIRDNPGVTQSVVGNALGIEKANLAGLLTEMHPRRVIERRSLRTDRRAYSLQLTAAGRKLVRKLARRHEQYEDALASNLGPNSRNQLLVLLGNLLNAT